MIRDEICPLCTVTYEGCSIGASKIRTYGRCQSCIDVVDHPATVKDKLTVSPPGIPARFSRPHRATERDEMALAILLALIRSGGGTVNTKTAAEFVYAQADAMIAAREIKE